MLKSWYCTVVYRDTPHALAVRVGDTLLKIGGKGSMEVKHVQFECLREHHSVEVYPPGRIFAVICSPDEGVDPGFLDSLAERDEIELSDPRRHVLVTPAEAFDLGLRK